MAKRKLSQTKKDVISQLSERYGTVVTRAQIVEFVASTDTPFPHWITNEKSVRLARATYNLAAFGLDGSGSSEIEGSAGVSDQTLDSDQGALQGETL